MGSVGLHKIHSIAEADMKIRTNEQGYVTDYALVGDISDSVEAPDLTEEELNTFIENHGAYKLIDGALVLDEDKLAADKAETEAQALSKQYIPSAQQSAAVIGRMMLKQLDLDDDERIQVSGLYDTWKPGKYEVGDIRNHGGQTWECFQEHDNAVYPDIRPGNSAWFTFWRPLHGKSPETARPFAAVQGAHDMYKAGEYAVYGGALYHCISDTAYSPEEYAAAWEEVG